MPVCDGRVPAVRFLVLGLRHRLASARAVCYTAPVAAPPDWQLQRVVDEIRTLDSSGQRTASVLRATFDQLYDGMRTGRYRWDQLHKTEKTHFGTLVEINMQREFKFKDGLSLDYRIAGIEVDCKYSQSMWGWMIPPEARGRLCLLLTADEGEPERDLYPPQWSMGLIRATKDRLTGGGNRDAKVQISKEGRPYVYWLFREARLPPNVLLHLPVDVTSHVMSGRSGLERLVRLYRHATMKIITRVTVETVAQQKDPMKRIRANGGARSALSDEGIVILGHYRRHTEIAEALDLPVPQMGETISVLLTPAEPGHHQGVVEIAGRRWRVARDDDPAHPAPILPSVSD